MVPAAFLLLTAPPAPVPIPANGRGDVAAKDRPVRLFVADVFGADAPTVRIADEVGGNVTLSLRGITRAQALAAALPQVGATYEEADGGFLVRPGRPEPSLALARVPPPVRYEGVDASEAVRTLLRAVGDPPVVFAERPRGRVYVSSAGARAGDVLAEILGQSGFRSEIREGRVLVSPGAAFAPASSGPRPGADFDRRVDVVKNRADLLDTVAELLRTAGADFVLDGRLRASVTCDLRDVTVSRALDIVTEAVGLTWRRGEDGLVRLFVRKG